MYIEKEKERKLYIDIQREKERNIYIYIYRESVCMCVVCESVVNEIPRMRRKDRKHDRNHSPDQ